MMKCLKRKRIDACTKSLFYLYTLYTHYLCVSNIYYIFLVNIILYTCSYFHQTEIKLQTPCISSYTKSEV